MSTCPLCFSLNSRLQIYFVIAAFLKVYFNRIIGRGELIKKAESQAPHRSPRSGQGNLHCNKGAQEL
jgi:hypothetical protein